jgi:hypothetical protein
LAPLEIAGHPPAWAGVGASNDFSNHSRTGAENGASVSFALVFALLANPPMLRRSAGGSGVGTLMLLWAIGTLLS